MICSAVLTRFTNATDRTAVASTVLACNASRGKITLRVHRGTGNVIDTALITVNMLRCGLKTNS